MSAIGKLLVYSTKLKLMGEYTITDAVFRIGRADNNDLTISDPLISSHHCKISPTMLEPLLEDMNSTNGTFVNFKRVKNHTLADQDIIMFKNYLIKFMCDPDVKSDNPSTEIPQDTVTSLQDCWSRRNEGEENTPKISVTAHQHR